jgi:hypothetical protein
VGKGIEMTYQKDEICDALRFKLLLVAKLHIKSIHTYHANGECQEEPNRS